jgi:hypothetical protein
MHEVNGPRARRRPETRRFVSFRSFVRQFGKTAPENGGLCSNIKRLMGCCRPQAGLIDSLKNPIPLPFDPIFG